MTGIRLRSILMAATLLVAANAQAHDEHYPDPYDRHNGEWIAVDGPCEVKQEHKGNNSLLEVKCKHGRGARWRGEWKEEFRDGRCIVKIDAKRDEYKEEVKCD